MSSPENDPVFFEVEIPLEPASKANRRKFVKFGNRPASIKSDKARAFEEAFAILLPPPLDPLPEGLVFAFIKVWYSSRRPDLDEALILDGLQGVAYKNDRQVRARLTSWGLDKERPRIQVALSPIDRWREVVARFDGVVEQDLGLRKRRSK